MGRPRRRRRSVPSHGHAAALHLDHARNYPQTNVGIRQALDDPELTPDLERLNLRKTPGISSDAWADRAEREGRPRAALIVQEPLPVPELCIASQAGLNTIARVR
jgi:hypothetical protein